MISVYEGWARRGVIAEMSSKGLGTLVSCLFLRRSVWSGLGAERLLFLLAWNRARRVQASCMPGLQASSS
jgi:hypothetical protein